MEWNLSWRFWRRDSAGRKGMLSAKSSNLGKEPTTIEDWEARLVEEGIAAEWATRLAVSLATSHRELGHGSAAALIAGAKLTTEAHAAEQADVERNMREVREVERLLGAFSGELEKLDEVLEVLAAYAQRMRPKPSKGSARRMLH